ncbi:heavy metal translocating P-type ATPase [Euzebya sp.]|uniref:heavy metal translocating P-type ATPase n=1 Tax=Euzebya sp. TaxID=1971409 RepID=UPI0035120036
MQLTSLRRHPALLLAGISVPLGAVLAWGGLDVAAAIAWSVGPALLLPGLAVATTRSALRREPGVDVIALLAMAGAIAAGEHLAGAIIAVMLTGGEALEAAAGRRAERELSALLAHAPRTAHLVRDGDVVDVDVGRVEVRDRLVVKTGEVVPVDGVLVDDAVLDESALTGESRPVTRRAHDRVASGVVNVGVTANLIATASAADSTYAGIVRLVETARDSKAPFVRMADRYAAWFVPLAMAAAGGAWALSGDPVRALAVLVVATPCPLLLAAPIAITSGISRAARRAIIVKHGGSLEALADVKTLCFDKTGTLTTGRPRLSEVVAVEGWDVDRVLELAASAEQLSAHPFAPALVAAARDGGLALTLPVAAEESPGEGIVAEVGAHRVAVGSSHLVLAGADAPPAMAVARRRAALEGASVAFVAVDGTYVAALHFEDPLRVEAARTVRMLRGAGVDRTVVVTGDVAAVADVVGAAVGVDEVLADQSPADKVAAVARLAADGPTAMVGDGVNDAPALAAAQVGIAMGARGATASSEAADLVITVDRLDRVAEAVVIAQRTRAIARQSAGVGMGLALVAMGVAANGLLTPVLGALLQEGIDVAAILNALRVLRARTGPDAPAVHVARSAEFLDAHTRLAAGVATIRRTADRLDSASPSALREDLAELLDFLSGELLPHERAEQEVLDDLIRSAHGGEDVLGALQRTHHEIERLARGLTAQVKGLPADGPGPDDVHALRPILYGLHALLSLQLAQEEEVYLALTGPPTAVTAAARG